MCTVGVVAGGTIIQATLAFEEVAPLHAARTSQRDVPTTLNNALAKYQPAEPELRDQQANNSDFAAHNCFTMR